MIDTLKSYNRVMYSILLFILLHSYTNNVNILLLFLKQYIIGKWDFFGEKTDSSI